MVYNVLYTDKLYTILLRRIDMKKPFNKYFEHTLLKPDSMKKEVID